MAPEDSCSADMFVMTRWSNRQFAVPLSRLKPIGAGESTAQAIGDWHYWIAQGTVSELRTSAENSRLIEVTSLLALSELEGSQGDLRRRAYRS